MVDGSPIDAICGIARRVAHEQALLLDAMARVAATSVGIGFDADEVAFALHLPRMVAQREVALARDLIHRLPEVFAALSDGLICLDRARVFSDVLVCVGDGPARQIAIELLAPAQEWTASQLRARLLKAILAADPDAARKRAQRSVDQRRVSLSANDDTTACLSGIYLAPAKAAAAFERVDAIARGLKRDGEARTLDQLRADVFCDLLAGISPASGPILRAGAVELLVPLATLTGEADAPATLAGYGPVTADVARQIATAYAEVSRHTDDGLAATARTANETVAPQPPVQWRFRVHDDGTLLFHGTTRARPTGHAGRHPRVPMATSTSAATATASARVSRARRRTRAYCAQRSPRIAR